MTLFKLQSPGSLSIKYSSNARAQSRDYVTSEDTDLRTIANMSYPAKTPGKLP